ncbi:NYN domain-containing protein [Candidatus Bathyarchaeota archaeon]|nr:MAG: NYN domain-containing protein [Candidatus Bathyarchaeota archaeon]
MGRVAILIDNMYLQHIQDEFQTGRIDIAKLPQVLLRAGEDHHRTWVFDALPYVPLNATQEQIARKDDKHRYLNALQYKERITVEQGVVRPKLTECYKCGAQFQVPVQKLVDVLISVRLVQLAFSDSVDRIVLVSGDADLLPAVEAAEESNTTIRLAYVEEGHVRTAKALIRKCPEKHQLTSADLSACKYVTPPLTGAMRTSDRVGG